MPGPDYSNEANLITTSSVQSWAQVPLNLSDYEHQKEASTTAARTALQATVATLVTASEIKAMTDKIDMAATLNESANANMYITDILSKEAKRVQVLDGTVKTEQYKLRNQLMMYEYLDGYYRTCTNVVIVSLYVTLLMLVFAALWRAHAMPAIWFWAGMLVLFLFYLMVMLIWVTALARTRRDSWQQKQWQVSSDMKKLLAKQQDAASSCGSTAGPTFNTSCDAMATQYTTDNAAAIATWCASEVVPSDASLSGKDVCTAMGDATKKAWAHYNNHGKDQGLLWNGVGCNKNLTCDEASKVFKGSNKDENKAVFATTKTATELYNFATANNRSWPGNSDCPAS